VRSEGTFKSLLLHFEFSITQKTNIPITSEANQRIEDFVARNETIPGPGQTPANPHPRPNKAEPRIKGGLRASRKFRSLGRRKRSLAMGFRRRFISGKVMRLTPTAPPITSIMSGVQVPSTRLLRSRNLKITAGLYIFERMSPYPKRAAEKKAATTQILLKDFGDVSAGGGFGFLQ